MRLRNDIESNLLDKVAPVTSGVTAPYQCLCTGFDIAAGQALLSLHVFKRKPPRHTGRLSLSPIASVFKKLVTLRSVARKSASGKI